MKSFAGIGSREDYPEAIRDKVLKTIFYASYALALRGFEMRSGGAEYTDTHFEQAYIKAQQNGAQGRMAIYLPTNYFNGRCADGDQYINAEAFSPAIREKQHAFTQQFHPAPAALRKKLLNQKNPPSNQFAITFPEKLMARNANQILGDDLQTPVNFVICAASGSKFNDNGEIYDVKGGTGQAVRIAYANKIPVFNLLHPPHLQRMMDFAKREQQRLKNPQPSEQHLTLG